jgi:hypothetical protein
MRHNLDSLVCLPPFPKRNAGNKCLQALAEETRNAYKFLLGKPPDALRDTTIHRRIMQK